MRIPLNTPYLEGKEKQYLTEVIDSKWLARGDFNRKFEIEMGAMCGVHHALSVTSGTVAVQVLLMAADLIGKKVALPAYTCMSVAQATVHAGVTPVFVDIEPDTLGIDFESLKRMYKKTKFDAVLINHLYGFIARDTFLILDWCKANGVDCLEDASEAHGASSKNRLAGSIGRGAALSVRAEKMIGVGEGGVVVTDDKKLWEKAYYWINDARPSERVRYWTTDAGWNLFMPNALAAIGLAQAEQIDEIIRRKRRIARWYQIEFAKRNQYLSVQRILPDYEPVYWLNVALLSDKLPLIREDLITMFDEVGIESRPGFYPLNRLPSYQNYPSDNTAVADIVGRRLIAFPSNVYMTQDDVKEVFRYFDKFTGVSL